MSSIKEQSAITIQKWIKDKSIWEWRDDYSGNIDNVKTNNEEVNELMKELDDELGGGTCWNIGFSALTRYIVNLETTNKELKEHHKKMIFNITRFAKEKDNENKEKNKKISWLKEIIKDDAKLNYEKAQKIDKLEDENKKLKDALKSNGIKKLWCDRCMDYVYTDYYHYKRSMCKDCNETSDHYAKTIQEWYRDLK